MATSTLRCFGIRSFDSAVAIGRAIEALAGVLELSVEVFTRRVRVTYGPPTSLDEVRQALDEAGFPCAAVLTRDPAPAPGRR